MKQIDAAKVLGFSGLCELTPEIIKRAYRLAAAKYHPDRNPAGLPMMQAINLAYETLKDFTGSLESGAENFDETLNEILNKIIVMQGVIIEVCGAWVWVTGDTKTHKEQLKEIGFFWANAKKAWYYRPADWKSSSRGKMSLDEIRTTYGSQSVGTKEKAKLKAA